MSSINPDEDLRERVARVWGELPSQVTAPQIESFCRASMPSHPGCAMRADDVADRARIRAALGGGAVTDEAMRDYCRATPADPYCLRNGLSTTADVEAQRALPEPERRAAQQAALSRARAEATRAGTRRAVAALGALTLACALGAWAIGD